MRTINIVAAAAATALLAGCSAPSDTDQRTADPEPTEVQHTPNHPKTPSPSQEQTGDNEPTETPRPVEEDAQVDNDGNVVKQLGEAAELSTPDGHPLYEVSVTSMYEIPDCEARVGDHRISPAGDTFLVAEVEASVSEDIVGITGMSVEEAYLPLVHDAFHVTTTDGEISEGVHGEYFGCFNEEELLDPFLGPGEESEGLLVLDVVGEPDTVTYDPDNTGGWSWQYDN